MKTFVVLCVLVAAAIAGPVNKFDWKRMVEMDPELKVLQSGHGSVKPGIESRITGGMVAVPHQFPYQVGLYLQIINENGDSEFAWCGASLISGRVVLTAAHCLYGVAGGLVLLGAHNIPDKNDGKVVVRVSANDFIIHEQYDPIISFNDIALIMLPEAAPLNKYIQTIDLPDPSEDELEGKQALITGWGDTGDNEDMSMDLRYAYLRILPAHYCQLIYPHVFHSTQICVSGANRKSVCSGDSGGPLVVPGPSGKNTVVGLTSFGRREGCQQGYPVVFTRVTSYLEWIEHNSGVKPKNY